MITTNFALYINDQAVCLVVQCLKSPTEIGHFVMDSLGKESAQEVEDSERQNNAHIR